MFDTGASDINANMQEDTVGDQAAQHAQQIVEQLCIADPLRRQYWRQRQETHTSRLDNSSMPVVFK